MRATRLRLLLALCAAGTACRAPDPKQELELLDLEGYWAVERALGETHYIAPVVRFRLRNKTAEPRRSIQATASFRRKGEQEVWSGGFQQVRGNKGRPLAAGEAAQVTLKPEGEGRYYSTAPPEQFFQHAQFKDVWAEVFVRVGSSSWTKLASVDVERRIGSKLAQQLERP